MLDFFEIRNKHNSKVRRMVMARSLSSPYRRANFLQRKGLRKMRVHKMF